jgi:hypothetical protein
MLVPGAAAALPHDAELVAVGANHTNTSFQRTYSSVGAGISRSTCALFAPKGGLAIGTVVLGAEFVYPP